MGGRQAVQGRWDQLLGFVPRGTEASNRGGRRKWARLLAVAVGGAIISRNLHQCDHHAEPCALVSIRCDVLESHRWWQGCFEALGTAPCAVSTAAAAAAAGRGGGPPAVLLTGVTCVTVVLACCRPSPRTTLMSTRQSL
jgi:hypothetical protein